MVRRSLGLVSVLLLTSAILGWPVYVRPQIDPLRHADAILILGGPVYDRYPFGLELGQQGWAPTVVVSNPNGPGDWWLKKYCETPNPHFKLYCFVPDPPTTRGEAQELRHLAAEYGWRTVIVVTFRPHLSRARFILEKCFKGNLIMVASPTSLSIANWVANYMYQTAGYLRAALDGEC